MESSIRFAWDEAAGRVTLTTPHLLAEWRAGADGVLRCVRVGDHVRAEWSDDTPATRAGSAAITDVEREDLPDGLVRLGFGVGTGFAGAGAVVRWTLEAHPAHAAVRQWATVTAVEREGGTGPGTERAGVAVVDRLPLLALDLGARANGLVAHCGLGRRAFGGSRPQADWYTWRTVPLSPGLVESVHSGHRREATWLGLLPLEGGPGLYVGWETNAEAHCEFGDLGGDGRVGVDVAMYPAYHLAPGERLVGPACFVGVADGDLDELSYRCHRYVEDRLAPKVPDERFPYVEFNSWGYGDDIDAEGMRRCLDVGERLGVELFVVDFGWEDPDWKPLPDRFPDGLAPLAKEVHDRGMLFGLHLSFGNVSSLSRMYAEHPEWANGPGQWAYRKEGEVFGLTFANPDTREWIVGKLVEIVDETGLDYFLTDHFLWGPADPDVTPLHATNDYLTVEGFDEVLARLHERRPHVVIEHCDDGLALPTFQMVRRHHTSIGPDATGALPERIGTHRISRVLPPRYLDHYASDRVVGDWELRSHMFGGPLILMTPIHELTPGSQEWSVLERNITLYKEIRHRVLRGKVLHLLEPQSADRAGDGWDGWDAIGSYDPVDDRAVVFVFRLGEGAAQRTVPLHGLRAETLYDVRMVDAGISQVASGADLMREGLLMNLSAREHREGPPRASEVVLIEPHDPTGAQPFGHPHENRG